MKQTIAEHEAQIKGIEDYLQRLGSWLQTLTHQYGHDAKWVQIKKEQYDKERKDFQFYRHQFDCAIRAKKNSFDRTKYLLK